MKNVKILLFIFCLLTVYGCANEKKAIHPVEQELLTFLDDPSWVKDIETINSDNKFFRLNSKDITQVIFVSNTEEKNLKLLLTKADNIATKEIVSILQNDIKADFDHFKINCLKVDKILKDKDIVINQYIDNFYSGYLFDLFIKDKITREEIYQTATNDIFVLLLLRYDDFKNYVKQQQKTILQLIHDAKYSDEIKNKNIKLFNDFIKQYVIDENVYKK